MRLILLFNILLEVVTALALDGNTIGANILVIYISDLCFADDISLAAKSINDLQHLMDKIHTTSSRFVLKVSTAKTEVQCIGQERQQMKTMLGYTQPMQCEDFVYHGGVIS